MKLLDRDMLWRQFGAAIDMLEDALRNCPDALWEKIQRCQDTLLNLTAEQAERPCSFAWGHVTFAELMLYTLRHVQEHAAHLNMYLGQHAPYRQAWKASAA